MQPGSAIACTSEWPEEDEGGPAAALYVVHGGPDIIPVNDTEDDDDTFSCGHAMVVI
jgi:hypothetical protein